MRLATVAGAGSSGNPGHDDLLRLVNKNTDDAGDDAS
jgi:hypothetical protein